MKNTSEAFLERQRSILWELDRWRRVDPLAKELWQQLWYRANAAQTLRELHEVELAITRR